MYIPHCVYSSVDRQFLAALFTRAKGLLPTLALVKNAKNMGVRKVISFTTVCGILTQWNIIIIILFFIFLAVLCGLWDLSSPTRDRTRAHGSESTDS